MAITTLKTTENSIDVAVILLDTAETCHDAYLLIEEAKSIVRDIMGPTNSRRKLDKILCILSKVLPLISSSVKSRATKGAPTNSNPRYVQARLLTTSTTQHPSFSPIDRLHNFVEKNTSVVKPTATTTPTRRSKRAKKR